MTVIFRNRLPQIMLELPAAVDGAVAAGAKLVEARAQARVPVDTGNLRDAIHTEREGLSEYAVKGGDNDAWYGHLVEFGTSSNPARPFIVPAAHETRDELGLLVAEAIRRVA